MVQVSRPDADDELGSETVSDSSLAASGDSGAFDRGLLEEAENTSPEQLHRHAVPAFQGDPEAAAEPAKPMGWESASARQYRNWLLVGVLSAAAAVMIIAALGFLFSKDDPIANGGDKQVDSTNTDNRASLPDGQTSDGTGTDDDTNDDDTNDDDTNDDDTNDDDTNDDDTNDDDTNDQTNGNTGIEDGGTDDPNIGSDKDSGTPDGGTPDGGTGDDVGTGGADRSDDNASTAIQQLGGFEDLLDHGPALDESAEAELARTPWGLIPSPQRQAADVPPWPKPLKRTSSVAAQLKIEIARLEFSETSLDQTLEFFSQLTTIPVGVDAEAYSRLGLGSSQRAAWEADDQTVEQLLDQFAQSLGLTVQTIDRTIVLGNSPDAADLVERSFDVTDLLDGETDTLAEFANGITSLVARHSWKEHGGIGTIGAAENLLQVRQTEQVLFEITVFLERLRLARGKSLRGLANAERVTLKPRFAPALERLATPATLKVVQPTELNRILRDLGELADIDVLIDWPVLAPQGWTHETKGTFQCTDEPFGEALARLLSPLNLSFRVLDETTIVVTTVDKVEKKTDLELYSVEGLNPTNLRQRIFDQVRPILGDRLVDRESGFALVFDDVSFTVLISAPQRHHAEIAQTLDRMVAIDKAAAAPLEKVADDE